MKVKLLARAGSSTFWRIECNGAEYGVTVNTREYAYTKEAHGVESIDTTYSVSCGTMFGMYNPEWTSEREALMDFAVRLAKGHNDNYGGKKI